MGYPVAVATTGLRELRQQASDLVRRAEAGGTILVTVNGREVAQLGPVRRRQWRRLAEIAEIFQGPADSEWAKDRSLFDDWLRDPFEDEGPSRNQRSVRSGDRR